jgi:MarR family transcriptional regulator, organic hydroperoxide resistance regulator
MLDAGNFLARLLRRAHLIASRRYRRHLAELGLSPGEARLLMSILERPGISPSALATATDVDPPTATGIVERLVAGGHLRRESDPHDRRRSLLFPTAAGEALGPAIRRARQVTEEEISALVGADDAALLHSLLTRLLESDARLQDAGAEHAEPTVPAPHTG